MSSVLVVVVALPHPIAVQFNSVSRRGIGARSFISTQPKAECYSQSPQEKCDQHSRKAPITVGSHKDTTPYYHTRPNDAKGSTNQTTGKRPPQWKGRGKRTVSKENHAEVGIWRIHKELPVSFRPNLTHTPRYETPWLTRVPRFKTAVTPSKVQLPSSSRDC